MHPQEECIQNNTLISSKIQQKMFKTTSGSFCVTGGKYIVKLLR